MVQGLKAARKAYSTPTFEVLEPAAAKAKLAKAEASQDVSTQEMLSAVKKQLEKPTFVGQSTTLSLSTK